MDKSTRISQLETNAVNASISWAKNNTGIFTMQRTVNEYLDAIGANVAPDNNPELIAGRRNLAVQRIAIKAVYALDKSQLQRLDAQLKDIADDLPESRHRSFHR